MAPLLWAALDKKVMEKEERAMARASWEEVARAKAVAARVKAILVALVVVVAALAVHLVALVAACLLMVGVACRDSVAVCQAMVAVVATLVLLLRPMVAWEIMAASQSVVVRASTANIERPCTPRRLSDILQRLAE